MVETETAPRSEADAGPRIDPRFVRRWVEVRRAAGRRRLRIAAVVATVAGVAALAVGSLYTPLLKVRHLRVSVAGPVTSSEVLTLAGLSHYKLMIGVHSSAIAARLDAVPYLGGARVVRLWPGTVTVHVGVRAPVALMQGRGPSGQVVWATVDPTGRVLSDTPTRILGMPVLEGIGVAPAPGQWLSGSRGPSVVPGTAPAVEVDMSASSDAADVPKGAAAALAAIQALPTNLRSEVMTVTIDPAGTLSMSILPATIASGSIPVHLGDGSQLAAKLTALTTLLAQADLSGVQSIDLTVPNRPAALTAR
jgi:hypothetical protein